MFDKKTSEEIFLGYFESSKGYRVYKKRTQSVKESINVSFCEANTVSSPKCSHVSESFVQEDNRKEDKEGKDSDSAEQAKEGSEANSETQANAEDLSTE